MRVVEALAVCVGGVMWYGVVVRAAGAGACSVVERDYISAAMMKVMQIDTGE